VLPILRKKVTIEFKKYCDLECLHHNAPVITVNDTQISDCGGITPKGNKDVQTDSINQSGIFQ